MPSRLQSMVVVVCLILLVDCQQMGKAQSEDKSLATISRLQSQVKRDYNNAELHYLLGNALLADRQFDQAQLQYEICLELKPPALLSGYARQALKLIKETTAARTSQYNQPAQSLPPAPSVSGPPVAAPVPEVSGADYVSAPPGTEITLTGVGFSANRNHDEVTIGGVHAEITEATATSLKCLIPSTMKWPAWYVPIAVKVDGVAARGAVTINLNERLIRNAGVP